MAEYIEREAVKAAVRKRLNNSLIIGWLISIVNEVPAVDVAPVVHGRWVAKPQMYRHPNARNYYCSECRYEPTETKDFCPLCGARMDGEGK